MSLRCEVPWTKPALAECLWYHAMHFPDGEAVDANLKIPHLAGYIGNYGISGKTVLDVGTASGYIAFHAKQAGAQVTALDAASTAEFRHVPFADQGSFSDLRTSRQHWENHNLIPTKKSWWYAWHKFGSKARCVYCPHVDLYMTNERFDVVIAGAIVEHLSDPLFSIGAWAKVAKEAVIISFTPVVDSDDLLMKPMTDLTNSLYNYAWWQLSRGLYAKLFDNLGFDIEIVSCEIIDSQQNVSRPTIVARRR